jgi:hypothetical protein
MKPPIDLLGNELVEGQFVGMKLGDQVLFGKIIKLSVGGVDLPNGKGKTAGSLLYMCQIPIFFNPGARIENLFSVIDPTSQSLLEKIADLGEQKKPDTSPTAN